MKYELAKKLWDKGFPFESRGDAVQMTCLCTKEVCEFMGRRWHRFNGNLHEEPTLSELIEACGERFDSLERDFNGKVFWSATAEDFGDLARTYYVEGSTPEEAVADLWLELNKK